MVSPSSFPPSAVLLLGFLPKKVVVRPEWLKCPDVEIIASASECISPAPPDRISLWQHNEAGLYDTEALAFGTIPPGTEVAYTPFAYRALPVALRDGLEHTWNPWADRPTPPPASDLSAYESLGFDVVGFGEGRCFECSPLSCNGVAAEQPVNRFCLVDDPTRAITLARDFSHPDSTVEPAWAYVVVEVLWRKDRM
ncbi:hypothetical protein [Polyangium aurulentum]|uniref:hypothetical protein n=1 Tax=Polyangium aurulentum TaxID=2567896 RepID=UPI0010AE593A|nr:hypothetical protein [Polyangium aurulentum]UQA57099.1 hypothetical protein E8A73_038285 [Polyangium aurulentum]